MAVQLLASELLNPESLTKLDKAKVSTKYAIIYWIETKEFNVMPLSRSPKDKREEGASVTLKAERKDWETKVVKIGENKATLTEEMNALIDAVLKQHQSTEDSAANNTPPTNRKRKLQFNASENGESDKSVASDKKQRAGGKKQKWPKVKHMATGEKENAPTKVVEKKTPKPNSNQKEKELAMAQAADDAALHYFNAHRLASSPDAIADLKKELDLLRQQHDAGSADSALGFLHQLLARPAGIFHPHATLVALEQLPDLAREKADERASRFGIILWQTRPLLNNPSFQQLLFKLIGSKGEVAIAKEIQKAFKQNPPV
ncbi:hypothetical protein OS493_000761 [Desmophyllum pertusum]|uniref:Uncharacterized protein n=1 Tax=Desmophyllum pertusum TaxID=174260 RepID=A0A9X0A8V7_9CNID|nr:hypothetical protein OS493_000761 [Desmophyllum pertusum]